MDNIIKILESINGLLITCPKCGETYAVKRARLFDIREPYSHKIKTVITNHKMRLQRELNSIEKNNQIYLNKIKSTPLLLFYQFPGIYFIIFINDTIKIQSGRLALQIDFTR